MRKVLALIGSAVFLVVAPAVVAGVVPFSISQWQFDDPFLGLTLFRFAGGALIVLGIAGLLECFGRFALQGLGTPAPVFPTRHLVVAGMYQHVRNPMYIAVVATIIGQALLFGNERVLVYCGMVWLLFHMFVLAYEEPKLRSTFGAEYDAYRAEVPRWIPRFTRGATHQPAHREG